MNNLKKLLGAAAVIIVVLIGLLIMMVIDRKELAPEPKVGTHSQTQEPSEQTNANENTNASDSLEAKSVKFDFVSNYKENSTISESYNNSTFDGKIVKTDLKTNVKTTVIPSVKAAYPVLNKGFNYTFQQLMESSTQQYLYLAVILMDTDAGIERIVRFDGNTNKFVELAIKPYLGYGSAISISKTSPYVYSIENPKDQNDERTLFLIDLDSDTAKVVTKLTAAETFSPCSIVGCMGDKIMEATWIDGSNIQIDVYATGKSKINKDGNTEALLVEKRKFKIN